MSSITAYIKPKQRNKLAPIRRKYIPNSQPLSESIAAAWLEKHGRRIFKRKQTIFLLIEYRGEFGYNTRKSTNELPPKDTVGISLPAIVQALRGVAYHRTASVEAVCLYGVWRQRGKDPYIYIEVIPQNLSTTHEIDEALKETERLFADFGIPLKRKQD